MTTTNSPKLRPLGDRLVVKQQEAETKTAGGIVIPDSVDRDNYKPTQGTVVATGPGKFIDGKLHPLQVKINDRVMYNKYSGTNIKLEGEEYLVIREEDVMGVLEEA